jgi:hypothetical protein
MEGIVEGRSTQGDLSATPFLFDTSAERRPVLSIEHSLRTGRPVVDFNGIESAVSWGRGETGDGKSFLHQARFLPRSSLCAHPHTWFDWKIRQVRNLSCGDTWSTWIWRFAASTARVVAR